MRKNKGITLIALVITVIILLILAGISMVTLTGKHGIVNKTTRAEKESEKTAIEEKIKLAIMAATNENGMDLEALEKELVDNINLIEGEIAKEGENGKLPWRVNHKGYSYRIAADGKIEEANGIFLNKTRLKLLPGQTENLEATLNGITGKIVWSTSNPAIATVENGTVVAVGNTIGETVEIIASVEGTSYRQKCQVTIVQKATQISAENLKIDIGEKQKIIVTTTPNENVEDLIYQFASTDIMKLTVDKDTGEVEGLASGTINVNISAKRKDGTTLPSTYCTVTVNSKEVYVTAKEIAENPSYYYGKTVANYGGRIFYVDKKTDEYPNGYFGDIERR